MKVAFLGSSDFVGPVKQAIAKNFELVENEPDLIVVASYGKILSKEELSLPKYGALNIHPSKLPKYRGPSPIQSQILDGISESAVSFIKMDEEVDHGPIVASIPFEISNEDTFESAAKKAFNVSADNLSKILEEYVSGKIKQVEQNHKEATYTKLLTRNDGYVDLSSESEVENWKLKIERAIRAFYPWPGVWSKFNGKVVKLLPEKKIQVEGKRPMTYKDFINGYEEGEKFLKELNLT
jgi:methionyl-tRNA formyltransferase